MYNLKGLTSLIRSLFLLFVIEKRGEEKVGLGRSAFFVFLLSSILAMVIGGVPEVFEA